MSDYSVVKEPLQERVLSNIVRCGEGLRNLFLHLSPFWGRFYPLFLLIGKKFFDFFICSKNRLGNSLLVNPFDVGNLTLSLSLNAI